MSNRPSPNRRRFLAAALGGTAASAGALPVIRGGGPLGAAAASPGEPPVVTFPGHPGAVFADGAAEPLNASVACGLPRRRGGA